MTLKQVICCVAVALMTTGTGYAQYAGSDCGSQACGNQAYGGAGCHGYHGCGDQYPSDTHCRRPWTYEEANALWADYCTKPIRQHHSLLDCCLGCCQPACNHCPSKWPCCGNCGDRNCGGGCNQNCGTGCGVGCGPGNGCNVLGQLFCQPCCQGPSYRGNGNWLTSPCCGSAGCCDGFLGKTPMPACDSCDSGAHCCSGPRHGMDLFGGLKSMGCGCGLGCDSAGCDSVGCSCGCN